MQREPMQLGERYNSPPPALTQPAFDDSYPPPLPTKTHTPHRLEDNDMLEPLQHYEPVVPPVVDSPPPVELSRHMPLLPPAQPLVRSHTQPNRTPHTRRVGKNVRGQRFMDDAYRGDGLAGRGMYAIHNQFGRKSRGGMTHGRRVGMVPRFDRGPDERFARVSNSGLFHELESNRNRVQYLEVNRSAMEERLRTLQQQVELSTAELKTLQSRVKKEMAERMAHARELETLNADIQQTVALERASSLESLTDDVKEAPEPKPSIDLRKIETEKQNLSTKIKGIEHTNMALEAGIEAIQLSMDHSQRDLEKNLINQQNRREMTSATNHQLEIERLMLTEHVMTLKEALDETRHEVIAACDDTKLPPVDANLFFASDALVTGNMIRAQCEFYFSDYNLKRDKKLLDLIMNDDVKPQGFLTAAQVLTLNRVKQLCPTEEHLLTAIRKSACLAIISKPDESEVPRRKKKRRNHSGKMYLIGRQNFTKPQEKEFPFRRTVYLHGIPSEANEAWVRSMLKPFGVVEKIEFDHGPDTLDRMIMKKMCARADRPKVYRLLSRETAAFTMVYAKAMDDSSGQFVCGWCGKRNDGFVEGFYVSENELSRVNAKRVCLQCAAFRAEEQVKLYEKGMDVSERNNAGDLKEILLGYRSRSLDDVKTALCVFGSQRQASKCVYVRSRLAHDGTLATHFHHYSKLKKEILMSLNREDVKFIGIGMTQMKRRKSEVVEEDETNFFETGSRPSVKRIVSADGVRGDGSNSEEAPDFLRVTSAPDFVNETAHVTTGLHESRNAKTLSAVEEE